MLHVKIKTEKTDAETAGARGRLDAVLQGLVEKSDSEREPNEDDSGKMATDSLSKDLSPSSAGKRPSSRFPQHRRKKRKEMDDGLSDNNQHKPNAYVIKLFDRSVDLAQFNTSTPLYPICRAWMRNNPSVRERAASPSPPHSLGEDEVADMLNGKGQNVYRLPPPSSCPVSPSGEPINLRIPFTEKPTVTKTSESVPVSIPLVYNHMERWKKIRQKHGKATPKILNVMPKDCENEMKFIKSNGDIRNVLVHLFLWKEASNKNQLRYSGSIKILKEMYER